MTYPVFIVCRDRYTSLVGLIDWLESVGNADEIYLMDNASAWPPLLEYYETTPHTVLRAGINAGHTVGWTEGFLGKYARERRFVLTDPDLLPTEDCPPDAIERMAAVLDRAPEKIRKAGFSLKIDDLPEHYRRKQQVIRHESRYWERWDSRVEAWRSPIDTTFALHSPWSVMEHRLKRSYRLPEPYVARHLPWYVDTDNLTEEEAYYRNNASRSITSWAR